MKYWSLIFGAIGILILLFAVRQRKKAKVDEFDDEIRFELYAQ